MNAEAARAALDGLAETWGQRYGAIIRLWENAWHEFIPFLDYDVEIRTVLCSTNAIESLNARYRRAIKARGHFPTEQAGWIQPVNATPCLRGEVHGLGASSDSGGGSAAVLVADPGG